MSISAKARSSARRTLRRIQEDGVRCEPVALEDAERAARTLVKLHRELWRGRQIDPEQLTPRYEAFMQTASKRMSARGIGRIYEFRRDDGEVLISRFLLYDKDFVGAYVISANQEASRRYQFITLGIWTAMSVASDRNSAYISLMHYTSWDKLRWASEMVSSQRMILARGRSSWVPYANHLPHTLRNRFYSLLSDAQVYVHSEDAPRWIKNATNRYWDLVRYVYSESAPPWLKNAPKGYYAIRGKYGYYALRNALRYKYELAQARREMRRSSHLKPGLSQRRTISEENYA
jgi:hypothetical protein